MSIRRRVALGLDLDHGAGMLADQVAGADIARDRLHLGEEAHGPQDRVAALAAPGRDHDAAALDRVEGGDQAVDQRRRSRRGMSPRQTTAPGASAGSAARPARSEVLSPSA